MLDEFPETFAFIFVDDGHSHKLWLLYVGPLPLERFEFMILGNLLRKIVVIKEDGSIGLDEVGETIGSRVIDLQWIIVINFVIITLITTMRSESEYYV